MRRPLLITAVLLSLPLLASAADLAVTVSFLPNPIAVGDALAWNAVVRNASGPAAQNVTLTFRASSEFQVATTLASPSCSGDAVIRCTAATLSPGQQVGFQVIAKAVAAGVGDLIVFAEEAGVNDPTTGDNVVTSPIVIKNNPRLSVSCTSPQSSFIVDPNSEATLTCLFGNSGVDDGHDVTLTIDLTGDATFAGPPAGHQTDCTLDAGGTRVECVTPLMRTNDSATVDVSIRAPDKRSGQFGAQAVATSRDVPFSDKAVQSNKAWGLPLSFLVTNTDDDGGGSLRQAIRDANVACNSKAPGVECLVAFHIPASLAIDGVYTIRPRTPLPALTGRSIVVGGDSQRLFAGDSNPKGLEIEINGSRLDAGPGFELTSGQTLREITINGFPGPGVAIAGGSLCCDGVTIRNCYIGTDAAGMRAVPNDRGIVVNLHALIYPSTIENNVISGNRFSGIFI
ncbi:MAG TPA: hypothetical protein VEZ11_18655, partial [Thermoanaerobaculia bacterium]|nr:hypothetical protein [Thermoanaerobaculia bacterium]